ncbi:MAG: MCP four helix bundle domain-containing protein, partial [Methylomonas sp.]
MKMTVAGKMMLLVAVTAFGVISLTGFEQNRLETVYEKTNLANAKGIPALAGLNKASESLGRMRVRLYRHVLYGGDSAKLAEIEPKIIESKEKVISALREYENRVLDATDRKLLDEDISTFNEYVRAAEQALEFSRQGKIPEARDLLAKNVVLAEKVNQAFNAHISYSVGLAQHMAAEASEAKSAAFWMSISLSIFFLLLIVIVAWYITRNLLMQLGGEPAIASEIANKIAAGDLSGEIDVKAGDTVSIMAAMKNLVVAIQALAGDSEMLAKAAVEGKLQTRADAGKHQGDFRTIVDGVNNTLDAVIGPLNVAARYVDDISKGQIPAKITDSYHG